MLSIFKKKKNRLKEQLDKRQKVIKDNSVGDFNYFDIQDYLELDKYSTYMFITPRNIGKTHSLHQLSIDWYNLTGEYTTWLRLKDVEIKEVIKDYKVDRPMPWPDWAEMKGNMLVDTRPEFKGRLIIKFLSISTLHNQASISGNGCGLTFIDEFLPRGGYPLPNEMKIITEFLKTVERGSLMTVVLTANPTTLNSQIIEAFGIWTDVDTIDDEDRRFRYRYFRDWENPPRVVGKSTSDTWASLVPGMLEFMNEGEVLDGSDQLILPLEKIKQKGPVVYYQNWTIKNIEMTWGRDFENKDILILGHKVDNGTIFTMTTEDALETKGDKVIPYSLKRTLAPAVESLKNNNLIFTDFTVRKTFIDFIKTLYGNIKRKDGI